MIKIDSEELYYTQRDGKVRSNIKEIPYGEQSQILYEDYNFDGVPDLALMDGQNSCYHSPSFQIYLSTSEGFQLSPEFTALAQENCGMFAVDPKTKTINTMTKSGCCWHQMAEYKVENNRPYPINIIEEGLSTSGLFWDYLEQTLKHGKMETKQYQTIAFEINEDNLLLEFEFGNNKKMQIIRDIAVLYCFITDANGNIELLYTDNFKYSYDENTLFFEDGQTAYTVFDDHIIIRKGQKIRQMKAKKNSINGSLSEIKTFKIENIIE